MGNSLHIQVKSIKKGNFLLTVTHCIMHLTYFGISITVLYMNNQNMLHPIKKKRGKVINSLIKDCLPWQILYLLFL